jgi:outer membrane protein assembly factor BamB
MRILAILGWMSALAAGMAAAQDGGSARNWPQFRGDGCRGLVADQDLPVKLGKETLAWSVPLPGNGSSSPVVWGDRLFVTSEDRKAGEVSLVCLDAGSGKTLWTRVVKTGGFHLHRMNNAAAASPCVSADAVVISWFDAVRKMVMLSGYSHGGKELWSVDVGPFKGQHGPSLQPAVHDGRIVFAHLHQGVGRVGVLDAGSGKEIWSTLYRNPNPKTAYCTPFVRNRLSEQGPRKEVVVVSTGLGVRGLDWETGKELWALPGVFKERCIVSPVDVLAGSGAKDALLIAGCKNNTFFAVRPPDATGAGPEMAWRIDKNAPYVPTPVSDGKTLYVLSDGGVLQAVDALSGGVRWRERLPGNFYASPLLVGGKLFCKSRAGEVFVAEVGEAFKLLATSDLEPGDEVAFADATPAVADNSLYIRVGARMDCYRARR